MGWFSSISNAVSDVVSSVSDAVAGIENTVKENPKTTALVGAAAGGYAYFGADAFAATEAGTALTATAETGSAAMAPEALSGIDLGGAGASPNSWLNATTANMTGSASAGWSAKDVLTATNTGLSLASTGAKLSLLGKSMDATNATANGLTGALAPSPIQTPSGLITTTPQGPMMTGTQAATGGFMGMDTQTLFVIAAGIAAVYYFSKHGK
jgi:hypothetical protein